MDNNNISIKIGDKVIRKDGLCGKVDIIIEDVFYVMQYENRSRESYSFPVDFSHFYLIGKTVLGNKIDEQELQRQLDEQYDKIKEEQAKYDQLRKQLWYLKNRMVEDWRERKEKHDKEKLDKNKFRGQ